MADELAQRIRDGQYEQGHMLPKAGQLAREMGFNIELGAAACDALQEAGLLEARDGWYYVGTAPEMKYRTPPEAAWRRVQREIRHEIEQGILEPGDELISSYETEDRRAGMSTIQRAFRALAGDGLVVKSGEAQSSIYIVAPQ